MNPNKLAPTDATDAHAQIISELLRRLTALEQATTKPGTYCPMGTITMFGATTVPSSGWLLCQGQAVSRTTYAGLFAVISTTWGVGDGSTTFNLPDLRGRAPIGAGTGTGLTARTLAGLVGTETVALATADIPTHSHSITDVAHGHTISGSTAGGHNTVAPVGGTFWRENAFTPSFNATFNTATLAPMDKITLTADADHTHGVGTLVNSSQNTGITTTNATGGAGSPTHANMQPSAVVNFIIKAL